LTRPSPEVLENINPKYMDRILIHHELTMYGEAEFHIVHKKSYFSKPSGEDVPAKYKTRKTFKGAEAAALHLLVNYDKFF